MTKLVLVFCPGASSTTMPLGIAALHAYVRRVLPDIPATLCDLSVRMGGADFHSLSSTDSAAAFFRGRSGTFFDEEQYLFHQCRWMEELETLRAEERRYTAALTTDPPNFSETKPFERRLFELLPLDGDEVVALSAAYPKQVFYAALTAMLIKRRFPQVTLLLGGSAMSALRVDELMRAVPELFAVHRGEGELGLTAFLSGTPIEEIPGFSYRRDGEVVSNPPPIGLLPSSLPPPSLALLPREAYLNPKPVAPVAFSRGCSWRRCRFCSHNNSFAGYRPSAVGTFVDTLESLVQGGDIRCFYFADQYIGALDLLNISEEIQRRDLDVRFHVMGRPTSDYTERVLETAASAGCRWISWGVESFSEDLLRLCNKGTDPQTILRVLRASKEAGISNLAMMIFGLPGSSERHFQETLDAASGISFAVDAFTSSAFQLFEKTPFYRRAERFALIPKEAERLFTIRRIEVHSHRRTYTVRDDLGRSTPPRTHEEVAKWKQWQLFVRGGDTFYERLPAEHYLLVASHRLDAPFGTKTPTRPASPSRPFRRAG